MIQLIQLRKSIKSIHKPHKNPSSKFNGQLLYMNQNDSVPSELGEHFEIAAMILFKFYYFHNALSQSIKKCKRMERGLRG